MLAAAHDAVVSTSATEQLGLRMRTGRHAVVPAARHELFMENDEIRAQVFAAFDAFITEQSRLGAQDVSLRPLCSSGVAAATIFPPFSGASPVQVVTTPPALSMIGISGAMSTFLSPASTARSIWPEASRQ